MELRDQQLHTHSRTAMGVLCLLLWVVVAMATLGVGVGTSFARYQSTGLANVQFTALGKARATVTESASTGESRGFYVTCNGETEGTGIRIRLYGSGDALQSLLLYRSDKNVSYTAIPYALSAGSVMGRQTGASWVYVLVDGNGQEVLFDPVTQPMSFTLNPTEANTDISGLQICAEVVEK